MTKMLPYRLLAGLSLLAIAAAEIFIYQPVYQPFEQQLVRVRRQSDAPHLNVHASPKTTFSCDGKQNGEYYADPETRCQAYHICLAGVGGKLNSMTFVCPNGTIFSQSTRVCSPYDRVYCSIQDRFYESLHGDLNVRRTDYQNPEDYANVRYPELPAVRRPSNDIGDDDDDYEEETPRTTPAPLSNNARRRQNQQRARNQQAPPPPPPQQPSPPRRQSPPRSPPPPAETPSPVRNSAPSQRRPVFRNTVSRGPTTTEAPETTTASRSSFRSRGQARPAVPQPPPVDLSEGVFQPAAGPPPVSRLPPGLRAARPIVSETPVAIGDDQPFTLPTLPPASAPVRPSFQPNVAGRPAAGVTRGPAPTTEAPTTLAPQTEAPTTRSAAPAAPGGNAEYDYVYDYDYPAPAQGK